MFKGTKCCPEERPTHSVIVEHPQSSVLFFIQKTVSNIRQSHLMTKPRTDACSFVFSIILSLHTKADRLQNQNHVGCIHYIFIRGITVVSILRCRQGFTAGLCLTDRRGWRGSSHAKKTAMWCYEGVMPFLKIFLQNNWNVARKLCHSSNNTRSTIKPRVERGK